MNFIAGEDHCSKIILCTWGRNSSVGSVLGLLFCVMQCCGVQPSSEPSVESIKGGLG